MTMVADWPILSLLIWLPIAGGLLTLLAGRDAPQIAYRLALAVALATGVVSLLLWFGFERGTAAMQFQEQTVWVAAFQIHYHLGVDGLSMPLILLTTLITVLVVIAAGESVKERLAYYLAAFLVLEGLMIGMFSALDAILFYVFFEAMLIPMFLIIGIWGGPRRVYATLKFFLYTFLGSVFMLIALIYLYLQGGSFAILDLHVLPLSMTAQFWIFLAFFAAFAVKIPMFPVHTWLPDAHVEAPTGGSVILAAIMLKIGGYGFLRFSLPITPDATATLDWLIILLSLIAVVYVGLVALIQSDMKKLIAYSSIAHMGFVTLGFFLAFWIFSSTGAWDGASLGIAGGMVQMISHGFISAAMFFAVGVLYDRLHSRNIADYGGVVQSMPWFASFFVLFAMANAGLPGTSGFVGEFLVILAAFRADFWIAFLAATTLILAAAYTLWMVKRVIFGAVGNARVAQLQDLTPREFLIMSILAFFVLWLGVWPAPLLEVMNASVEQLVAHLAVSKLPAF
jgi:NADH-quinone oxidoreductase subunit M